MAVIEQGAPLSPELLEEFAGKWVAVRGDEVVAAAESLEELRANDKVRRNDAVFIVPEPGLYFY